MSSILFIVNPAKKSYYKTPDIRAESDDLAGHSKTKIRAGTTNKGGEIMGLSIMNNKNCDPLPVLLKIVPKIHHGAVQKLHDFVSKYGDHDSTHGVVHVTWVTFNSAILVRDRELVQERYLKMLCAAMLHDVLDAKYILKVGGSVDAVTASMKTLLMELLSSEEGVTEVLDIAENTSFSKEKKGLLKELPPLVQELRNVVSDGDKLEAIGFDGIARSYMFQEVFKPGDSHANWLKDTVEHCYEKLLLLREHYIRTPEGKELGLALQSEMELFCERYKEDPQV